MTARAIPVLAVIGLGLIAIAGSVLFTVALLRPPPKPCPAPCGPIIVVPLRPTGLYRSSDLGFEVGYPGSWRQVQASATGVVLETPTARVSVTGRRGATSAEELLRQEVQAAAGDWAGLVLAAPIRGAHLGYVDGAGAIYAGVQAGAGTAATRRRLAVVAVQRGGVEAVMSAVEPENTNWQPSGIGEAQALDLLLSEFRWRAGP